MAAVLHGKFNVFFGKNRLIYNHASSPFTALFIGTYFSILYKKCQVRSYFTLAYFFSLDISSQTYETYVNTVKLVKTNHEKLLKFAFICEKSTKRLLKILQRNNSHFQAYL